MRISRWGGAAILGAAVALALAAPAAAQEDPATAHGQPGFTAAAGEDCGEVAITFTNATPWLMVFDVRVDGEASINPSVAEGVEIAEGPLAGQEFGPRWTLVEVDGRADVHEVTETFAFTDSVEVRLAEGAEQKLFFDFTTVDTSVIKACPEPTPTPTAEPTMEPTTEPTKPADPSPSDPAGGAGGGSDKPGLPVTGSPLPILGGAGAALLAGGGGLYWFTRRRGATFTA